MALQADGSAPYGPVAAVLQVVERYRDRGLPTPFTSEVLAKAGVKESVIGRTLSTLQQLDLIDPLGNPTAPLQHYARCPGEEAETRWREIVREAYAPIFSFVDPESDSRERIRDAFRSYEPRSQQDRMVMLFVGLCKHGGLKVKEDAPRPRQSTPRLVARTTSRDQGSRFPVVKRTSINGAGNAAGHVTDRITQDRLPEPVDGMVRELASIGPSWTKARRDQFMKAWEAVIDFSYPVHGPAEPEYIDEAGP
jgi:hypothetical protein